MTKLRSVGYVRVSTDKQKVDGYSLEAQTAKIAGLAAVKDHELIEVISDDESAKNLKRPGVQRIIAMVKAGQVDAVIIMKLDRFTRSVKDLADVMELFNKHNVALISLTESIDTKTAAGELSMNITTSVSQWERKAIGERTQAVMDFKRSKGEVLGNLPYGYTRQGKLLEPSEPEQAIIRRIHCMRTVGESLNAIATTLNADGLRTRRNSEWRKASIFDVLTAAEVVLAA
jgi:site-specific DNA recombinase